MTLQLTERDRELLSVLTRRSRLLTERQVARTWYPENCEPNRAARRRLRELEGEGLVERLTVVAHPELELSEPVFRWSPGDSEPLFGRIAYQLQVRWSRPVVGTSVVIATRGANHRLGGYIGARRSRRSETTHDIHLAQVYLWYRLHRPAFAKRWVSEQEQYARGGGRNERLPDALIRGRNGSVRLVVEFGGAYNKQKLQEFHDAVSCHPYQLW